METRSKTFRLFQCVKSFSILFSLLLISSCILNQQDFQREKRPLSSSPPDSKLSEVKEVPDDSTPAAAADGGTPANISETGKKPILSPTKTKRIVSHPIQKRKSAKKKAAKKVAKKTSITAVFAGENKADTILQSEQYANLEATAAGPAGLAYAPPSEPATQASSMTPSQKYEEYKAVLAADPTIVVPGPPGRLRVWIGVPDYKPDFPINMQQASGMLPALGSRAKITPYAPAFTVEPKDGGCIRIDPSGSEIGFSLTPLREENGTFDVGADVQLYDTDDCSGIPIPKATKSLQVQVVVKHAKKFNEVFWEMLLKFWGELLLLLFAVILFLIRKQLKKWVGFDKQGE